MEIVASFAYLLQGLSPVMTAPTFARFTQLITGWLFASRRTVTGMLRAAGLAGRRHHSGFHRLFSDARWSLDQLGLTVLRLILPLLGEGRIFVTVDDTLARKRGIKMFGTGMHHDPLLSSRGHTVTNWGHSWVVLSIILPSRLRPGHYYSLPILFRLYLNRKSAARERRAYRSRPELAVELLALLGKAQPNRRFHAVADSAYGGKSVLCHLPGNFDLTSRLVLDARLHELPPARQPGAKGRPRKRGGKLPTPAEMLAERCANVTLDLYGRHDRVRLATATACQFAAPDRLLRIVAVEALVGGRGRQAFYSTDTQANASDVLTWYAQRWSIEVAFHDSKQPRVEYYSGFEEPQGWTRPAAQRTAPIAMLLYTLIVVWFQQEGHTQWKPQKTSWYQKQHASFGDMLATLRRETLRERVICWGLHGPGSQKILETLENVLALAV